MKSPINHRLRLRMKDKLKILLCPRHTFTHFTLIPLLSEPSDLRLMTYSQIKTVQPLSFFCPSQTSWPKTFKYVCLEQGRLLHASRKRHLKCIHDWSISCLYWAFCLLSVPNFFKMRVLFQGVFMVYVVFFLFCFVLQVSHNLE